MLLSITLFCYAIGILGFWWFFRFADSSAWGWRFLHGVVVWLAFVVHGFLLYSWIHEPDGLNFNILLACSLISWLIALTTFVPHLRPVLNKAVLQLSGLVFAFCFVGLARWVPLEAHLISPHVPQLVHISLSLVAYSLLCVAGLQAVLLSFQNYRLKSHHLSRSLSALPPVEVMESILLKLIFWGTILLTIALATGLVFTEDFVEQQLVHKTFFSCLAWVIFVALLLGHHHFGWRSQTAARWTVCGLMLLVVGYFGSKFVVEVLLT